MKTLLIVEDEKLIRQGVKNMIQRSGVPIEVIIECNNGEAALEILKEQKIDVMFTDIRMPKMDGIQLVQAMKELPYQPLTVVISGYDDFSYAVEMLRMGVKEYILKPVDRNQINSIMEKLEEEVTKKKEEELTRKTISLQQLRYLCMESQLEEKERALIEGQFSKEFAKGPYEVCCCNCTLEGEEQTSTCIYLGTVDKFQVFIVECENKGFLLQKELQNSFVGFSEPVEGIAMLPKAYKQAAAARKQAFATATRVVDYDSQKMAHLHGLEGLSEEQEREIDTLVTKLGSGHVEDVEKQLEDWIVAVTGQKQSMELLENWISCFLQLVVKKYEKVLKVEKEDLLELENMYQYQTLSEYAKTLSAWIAKFHDLISEEFDDYKNKKKIQQALVFMQENYQKDLNMAVVSNSISMNYSLFSYAFKQYTGKNFVTYLKELRIEEAKKLLRTTDMKVIDISGEVGFENEKHFMKTFKAICGVSPTEYRRANLTNL